MDSAYSIYTIFTIWVTLTQPQYKLVYILELIIYGDTSIAGAKIL